MEQSTILNETTSEFTIPDTNVKVLMPKANSLLEFATKVNKDPNAVDLYQLELQRAQNPPNVEAREASYNLNRSTSTKGTGTYQLMVRAERFALKEGLGRFWDDLPNKSRYQKHELLSMVDYLPNARFGYLNMLIKKALEGFALKQKLITQADVDFIRTMWINPQAKETLIRFLSDNVNKDLDGYSITPVQSRSAVKLFDMPGINTGQYIALKNPGNLYFPIEGNQSAQVEDKIPEDKFVRLMEILDNRVKKLLDDIEYAEEFGSSISKLPDNEVQRTLLWFSDKIMDKQISYKDLLSLAEQLNKHLSLKRSRYLLSLANPWKHKSARIPTLLSPPSACFTLRSIIPLTTNASGNVAFVFTPFALFASGSTTTTFSVNNNVALTGAASSNFFEGVNAGQSLPADFYTRYRIVSAGLRIHCYPSSNNDNGIVTISVTFENAGLSAIGAVNATAAQFGEYSQVENGYYKQTTTVASRVVQEHVYIPLDESFLEYKVLGTSNPGFAWTGYITGASASSTIARIETICNYEAILDNQYTDYLPSDTPFDEIDPKTIPIFVGKLRQEAEVLSPSTLNDVLKIDNTGSVSDVINLPDTPRQKKQKQELLRDQLTEVSNLTKEFFPSVPSHNRSGTFSKVMEFLSPIAKTAFQVAASKYLPMLPAMF